LLSSVEAMPYRQKIARVKHEMLRRRL